MPFGWNQKTLAFRVVGTTLSVASASLFAQTAINLEAQPLSKSLSQLARERGVNILAPDNLVAGRNAPAVSGVLTVPQALDRLLQGSGLTAQQQDEKTYVIRALPPPPPRESAPNAAVSVLPTITVTDSTQAAATGFSAESTSSATRTDTPLSEIPQSVQVVTGQVLQSQQAQSVDDALRNVSSVTLSNINANTIGGTPNIRGMQAAVSINGGMNLASTDAALALPTVALASVEVLKGANAILAGSSNPAGIVNVNIKRPQAEPVRELTMQTGSYGNWMSAFDLAGAISDDKKLTYRFIVSGERTGQDFTGHDGKRDFYLAPSVGWHDGGTDLVVGFEQHVARQPPTPFTLILPTGLQPLSGLSGRADDHMAMNSTSVYYDWKQKLTPALTLQSKARYIAESGSYSTYTVFPLVMPDADPMAVYLGYLDDYHTRSFNLDNNIQAKFNTGPVRHTMLAGFAYTTSWISATGSSAYGGIGAFPQSNLPPLGEVVTPNADLTLSQRAFQNIFYFQDQLTWGRLHVLASASHGQAWSTTTPSQSAWSPNIGFVYQLTDTVGVYANALRSFTPQTNIALVGGGFAPPTTGRSVEAGVKLNLLDDRLTGSISVYRAALYNVAMGDPAHPGFSFVAPGIVSRGVEVDMSGSLLPGWNVIASYTYANQLPTSGNLSQLPTNAVSLWTTYDLRGETLHGWGAGIGIQARTSYRAYDVTGADHPVPGQARVDASIYYHAKKWSATLGVKNLMNRTLYGDLATGGQVEVLPGRLLYLTAVYDF